jgi:hypothetical protein
MHYIEIYHAAVAGVMLFFAGMWVGNVLTNARRRYRGER